MNAKSHISIQNIIAIASTLIGITLDCKAYYPGFLSPDSIDQYQQALTHHYSDWHPPIMAGFWSLLLPFHAGGTMLFLIQVLTFWLAFFICFKTAINHFPKIAFMIPLFFFAPFIQNFIGNIWKDVELGISWLLAVSIIIKAHFEKRRLNLIESCFSLLLLFYGCWIRINAYPGLLPLLLLWLYSIRNNINEVIPVKKIILKILGLSFLLFTIQVCITKLILKPDKSFPEYKLFTHDLTGIYKKTGELCFPKFIIGYNGFDTTYLKQNYSSSSFDNIWWNEDHKTIFPPADSDKMKILQKFWIKTILNHPICYLKNRTKGFLQFLKISTHEGSLVLTYFDINSNNFGLSFISNKYTTFLKKSIELQRPMPYMKPWFWLLLNLFFILIAFKKRFRKVKFLVLCLSYSSLFYFAFEFFVFQTDTDFRYFYWNCIAVSLAGILLLVEISNKKTMKQNPQAQQDM